MKTVLTLSLATAITALTAMPASANLPLAQKNNCTGCHAVDRKLLGPGFREIAERYRNDHGAADRLARKIREGGAGAWGPTPMPPHQQLSSGDLTLIVSWIMAQQ